MFTDKIELKDYDKMNLEYKQLMGHLLTIQADCEMIQSDDEGKVKAQRTVDFWYVRALDMFGGSDSKRSERYRYWGLKRRTNEQARQDYMNEVGPILTQMGLKVPDPNKGRRYN